MQKTHSKKILVPAFILGGCVIIFFIAYYFTGGHCIGSSLDGDTNDPCSFGQFIIAQSRELIGEVELFFLSILFRFPALLLLIPVLFVLLVLANRNLIGRQQS